ncbi:MAG: site-specific integrase, partial [Bacteroidales bacterium]|nr:site-specific integrase [Bacteroidales bacterium]
MVSASTFFDQRMADKKGLYSLYWVLNKNGSRAVSSLGIKLAEEQWKDGKVIKHPQKDFLNRFISAKMGDINRAILELSYSGALVNKTAKESIKAINEHLDPDLAAKNIEAQHLKEVEETSFARFFRKHIERYDNSGTRQLYEDTYNKMKDYCQSEGIDFLSVSFSDINKKWLESFEKYCLTTQRQNTANRHLRDIRAVFNAAIDEELTTNYPFRKFKIRKEATIDKSFTAAELRNLFSYKHCTGRQQEAIDMFELMFCLIGINGVDLAKARDKDVCKGRLNYKRTKTGKNYSIKVEEEALIIINRYKGKDGNLVNVMDRESSRKNKDYNYHSYFNWMAKTLRNLDGGTLVPHICSGSARTSWATIAQEELDIPR